MEQLENKLFAKDDLHHAVRMITALKIVAKKFCRRNFNTPAILFALMSESSLSISSHKRLAVGDTIFGEKVSQEIKEMFIKFYHDDNILLDYLNKKITDRYFIRMRKSQMSEDDANTAVKAIINNGFLSTFLNG